MRSYARRLAQRKSCLMAVWPRDRISWVSPLHPDTPRNFAVSPMSWSTLTPAMAAIGTNDFEWEIDSQWFGGTSGVVFYNVTGSPSYNTIGWYIYPDNATYSGYICHSGLVTDPVDTYRDSTIVASGTNVLLSTVKKSYLATTARFIIKIKRVGAVVSIYVNNVLAKTIAGTAPIALTNMSTGSLASSANCNIASVYLKNLTSNTVVWQAAHSDLYTTNNPWPSATMRNFASEPESWRALSILQQQIGDNDNGSFFIDFEWQYDGAPVSTVSIMNGTGSGLRFGAYATAAGTVTVFSNLLGASNSYVYKDVRTASPMSRGRHVIRARVVGTTFYAQLDSEAEVSTTGARVGGKTPAISTSNANMNIYNAWERNDTTAKVVWHYPSFAEKTRLVKQMSNVAYWNGYFDGVNTGVIRGIKTALDLRGNTTSKTMICRCYIPSHVGANALFLSGLATQGYYSLGSVTAQVFNFSMWEDRRSSGSRRMYVAYSGASGTVKGTTFLTDAYNVLERWVTLACVYDYTLGKVVAYVDGVRIGEQSVVMEPFGQGADSAMSDAVAILQDASAGSASGHYIAWAQVHEGVLPDQVIAACAA